MIDDELTLELFRLEYRAEILSRLVLKLALDAAAKEHDQSFSPAAAGRRQVQDWLRQQQSIADQVLGKRTKDPAQIALLADEAKEVTDSLIDLLMHIPDPI